MLYIKNYTAHQQRRFFFFLIMIIQRLCLPKRWLYDPVAASVVIPGTSEVYTFETAARVAVCIYIYIYTYRWDCETITTRPRRWCWWECLFVWLPLQHCCRCSNRAHNVDQFCWWNVRMPIPTYAAIVSACFGWVNAFSRRSLRCVGSGGFFVFFYYF